MSSFRVPASPSRSIFAVAAPFARSRRARAALAFAILVALAPAASAMETLMYKGTLRDNDKAANGTYDLQVRLFTAEVGGTAITFPITLPQVRVSGGHFQVPVDLPGKLPANASVWIEAQIKPPGAVNFVPLAGRQEISPELGGTCWEATGNSGLTSGTLGITSNTASLVTLRNNTSSFYLRGTGGVEQGGSTASGGDSAAFGGTSVAAAPNSFVAGKGLTAAGHTYSMVFADGQGGNGSFASTAANQFLVRAQNGVGINTNAPRGTLSVQRGGVSGAGAVSPSAITAESDTNLYMTMLTPSTQERGILFGDQANTAKGGIIFNPVTAGQTNQDGITFRTGGNQDRMKITSNGILLLNTQGDPPEADVSFRSAAGGNTDFFMNLRSESGNLGRLSVANGPSANFQITAETGDLILFTNQFARSVRTVGTPFGVNRVPAVNALEVEGNASKTTATAWLANSDRRIKQAIAPIGDALSLINRLEPVKFRYTDAYRSAHPKIADHAYYNVIAQDFAEVFPDSVQGSGEYLPGSAQSKANEILQVDTYPATITAIAAIQELDAKSGAQEDRVAALETENAQLRARLAALEQAVLGRNAASTR